MSLILDGTNGLSDVDGSAATPAIRGSDANTGVFFPAADTIAFAEGGVEVARFDASGNFLVGQTTPVTSGRGVTVNGSQQSFIVRNGVSDYNEIGVWAGASDDVKGQLVAVTPDNKVLVGSRTNHPLVFNVNDTERARIDTSGRVFINTTTNPLPNNGTGRINVVVPSGDDGFNIKHEHTGNCFNIWRTASDGPVHTFYRSNALPQVQVGSISITGSATSYGTSSDYRLKHDIQPMSGALAKVAQLKPVTYKWNADDSQSQGFIAHELQEVVPECVTGEKDAVDAAGKPQYQGIDTSFLVATLAAAIQELKGINDAQAQIITALTARVEALEGAQA
jgi:hypothetical protein